MSGSRALRIALDLRHVPSLVRHVRTEPLPDGVPLLLRIAAGDPEAEQTALALVDRSLADIQEAAAFFIEQILFAPESSSYRVLGASPEASAAELRRNMALLMRWLHPDTEGQDERRVFAGRVSAAWEDLKTPERRAAYDSRMAAEQSRSSRHRKARLRKRSASMGRRKVAHDLTVSRIAHRTLKDRRRGRLGLLRRVLSLLSRRR